jgi:copper chaperone CopZ
MTEKKNVKLMVNGIHCNGCANKIKNGLSSLDSESHVDVNVATGEVRVSYNGNKSTLSEIKNIISNVGFSVESVELE